MKTCNDRKEERGGRKESEREQALEGCVCLCQGETMANVVVNLFCAKFKNIFTPCSGPAPLTLSCLQLPPVPLPPRPLPTLDYDANNDIYIFYLPTQSIFAFFFAPLLLFYSPFPLSFCLSLSTPPCFFACVNLP